MGRKRGERHNINRGEQLRIGPLRILINNLDKEHTEAETYVFYGEKGCLGSSTVPIKVLGELKSELSEVPYA